MRKIINKNIVMTGMLIAIILFILAAVLPYITHKKVSNIYKTTIAAIDFYNDETGSERIAYLDDNTEAMVYRLKMIEEAEKEIFMSTFDFNADQAGKEMMSALLHAAEKGVKVQILVDGISGFTDLNGNRWFQAFASNENISIHIYNPVNLLKPYKLQARLHDKYLIIDNKMYLLGGRNTSNLFLGDYTAKKNIDRELFVYETVPGMNTSLNNLKTYFSQIWELPDCKPYMPANKIEKIKEFQEELNAQYETLADTYPQIRLEHSWLEKTMETNRITLLSNPIEAENKEPWLWYSINQLIKEGKEVTIHSPYIICGKEMYQDLAEICKTVGTVNLITNNVVSGANPWGCTDYLNEKETILQTGVRVYEYLNEHSSHSKTIRIDDRISIVGSYNFDMRSTYLNTELMLVVDSVNLNQLLMEEERGNMEYSRSISQGSEYRYGTNYHERELSRSKKIMYGLLRIIVRPIRKLL